MGSDMKPMRIVVEIEHAEPFRGTVAEPGHAPQRFNGWTAFAAVIAAVVRRLGPPGVTPDDPDEASGG